MITIYIDNQAYRVDPDQNLLQACLSLKLDLPYFCWHPAMGSVGACRQCAMTQYLDERDTRGRLIVACMTPVTDGMRVSLTGQSETEFREQVIATLMTNHPHDCPVCAEGGECHLQDMTVMTGHHSREYEGNKRTHHNQYLGPLIKHEMNRCIACYRCERFYRDYAGGSDLAAQGSKHHVYFGRQQDGILENEFAGNLCEVCPTGVFTDKPFGDHYSRKWDLNSAPSVCPHCSLGCNISYQERYGSVRRVVNRFHKDINQYFICDRGRFGHGFANSDTRLTQILTQGKASEAKFDHPKLQANLREAANLPFYGIGDRSDSLETLYALKSLVGPERFCPGLTDNELTLLRQHAQILRQVPAPSLADMESADCIVILDEDIGNTAPRMALAVRQALNNKGQEAAAALGIANWQDSAVRLLSRSHQVPLSIVANGQHKLDAVATRRLCLDSEQTTLFLEKLYGHFDHTAPTHLLGELETPHQDALTALVTELSEAKRPLIIAGWQQGQVSTLVQAANLHKSLNNPDAMLCLVPQGANTMAMSALVDDATLGLEQIAKARGESKNKYGLLLTDCDIFEHLPKPTAQTCLSQAEVVLQLAARENRCTPYCHLTLPSNDFTEQDGYLVNYEGRLQAFYAITQAQGLAQPAWRWLTRLRGMWASKTTATPGKNTRWQSFHDLQSDMVEALDLPLGLIFNPNTSKTARGTPRTSGRTAMLANQTVHEPKPDQDLTSGFSFTMEGKRSGSINASGAMPYSWSPGWNSNQSVHKFQQEQAIVTNNDHFLFRGKGELDKYPPLPERHHKRPVSVHHVFGSEALSLHSAELATLVMPPSLHLPPEDAKQHGLFDKQVVTCQAHGQRWLAQVHLDANLVSGTIGLFLPKYGDTHIPLPEHLEFSPASDQEKHIFEQGIKTRQNKLESERKAKLERLRAQDAWIPIRMVGMEDQA